jgi:hypothetical protein
MKCYRRKETGVAAPAIEGSLGNASGRAAAQNLSQNESLYVREKE